MKEPVVESESEEEVAAEDVGNVEEQDEFDEFITQTPEPRPAPVTPEKCGCVAATDGTVVTSCFKPIDATSYFSDSHLDKTPGAVRKCNKEGCIHSFTSVKKRMKETPKDWWFVGPSSPIMVCEVANIADTCYCMVAYCMPCYTDLCVEQNQMPDSFAEKRASTRTTKRHNWPLAPR